MYSFKEHNNDNKMIHIWFYIIETNNAFISLQYIGHANTCKVTSKVNFWTSEKMHMHDFPNKINKKYEITALELLSAKHEHDCDRMEFGFDQTFYLLMTG